MSSGEGRAAGPSVSSLFLYSIHKNQPMAFNTPFSLLLLFCFLVCLLASASATASFISDNALHSHESSGRALLQTKKSCPVSFEFLNYTIMTSQCKGPQYSPKLCCGALKEFACPYAEELNDLTNDCSSTMFSYIDLYGKYPPGLFASECKEGKEGLECPAEAPNQSANDTKSGAIRGQIVSSYLTITAAFLVLFFRSF